LDTYSHLLPNLQHDAASKLDAVLAEDTLEQVAGV
jgi:hypothetical protein